MEQLHQRLPWISPPTSQLVQVKTQTIVRFRYCFFFAFNKTRCLPSIQPIGAIWNAYSIVFFTSNLSVRILWGGLDHLASKRHGDCGALQRNLLWPRTRGGIHFPVYNCAYKHLSHLHAHVGPISAAVVGKVRHQDRLFHLVTKRSSSVLAAHYCWLIDAFAVTGLLLPTIVAYPTDCVEIASIVR